MFALLALIAAFVAWVIDVFGGGLHDPWEWLFAVLVFLAAHLVTTGPDLGWPPRFRRGS